jgi:malate dehydrogenase (oxaloacetate-decarboxylating)(NADP+)
MEKIEFGRDYLIPKPFDTRVLLRVTSAVAKAACESGVARHPIADFDHYQEQLERRLGRSKEVMRQVINKAKRRSQRVTQSRESSSPYQPPMTQAATLEPIRIAFPEGEDERIIRAAIRIVAEEIGKPILFGNATEIETLAKQLAINLQGIEVLDPQTHPRREALAQRFFAMRARRGVTLAEAQRYVLRRHYYAPLLLLEGEVDAVVCGETYHYPDSIRPALQILPLAEGIRHVSGLYMLLFKNQLVFCADTTVNITPDAETLVEIALCAADTASRFDIEPKIALLSFSNFGSVNHNLVKLVQEAVTQVQHRRPDLVIDGEMQADTAINEEILHSTYPFSRLTEAANVLIFPDLTSGNIAYKLLVELGGAEAIGPILMGLSKPYHVLQRGASVDAIVNIAAIAAVQAQEIEHE